MIQEYSSLILFLLFIFEGRKKHSQIHSRIFILLNLMNFYSSVPVNILYWFILMLLVRNFIQSLIFDHFSIIKFQIYLLIHLMTYSILFLILVFMIKFYFVTIFFFDLSNPMVLINKLSRTIVMQAKNNLLR